MTEAWSREEIELITADYLVMLMAEVRGERYNKAEHRRALMKQLNGRNDSSIEYNPLYVVFVSLYGQLKGSS